MNTVDCLSVYPDEIGSLAENLVDMYSNLKGNFLNLITPSRKWNNTGNVLYYILSCRSNFLVQTKNKLDF